MSEFWIYIGFFVVLVIAIIAMYNSIISAFNMVKRAWADVHTYERQKIKILESLEPVLQQYVEHESKTLKEIVALRSSIQSLGAEPNVKALAEVQRGTGDLLRGLSLVVENYPDLKANTVFLDLMANIRRQNENVGAAIAIFNRNVEIFNTKIETVPTNLVNSWFAHKTRVEEFSESQAAENIEYRPNL